MRDADLKRLKKALYDYEERAYRIITADSLGYHKQLMGERRKVLNIVREIEDVAFEEGFVDGESGPGAS